MSCAFLLPFCTVEWLRSHARRHSPLLLCNSCERASEFPCAERQTLAAAHTERAQREKTLTQAEKVTLAFAIQEPNKTSHYDDDDDDNSTAKSHTQTHTLNSLSVRYGNFRVAASNKTTTTTTGLNILILTFSQQSSLTWTRLDRTRQHTHTHTTTRILISIYTNYNC